MSGPAIELHQFNYSHYNEKARWALDFKGLAHRRVSHLPGPHRRPIAKLTGQEQVPVVVIDGEAVAGSAAIIDALEGRFPEPALYPADPEQRKAALDWQAWLDDELGPAIRRANFSLMVDEAAYIAGMFGRGMSPLTRTAYRMMLPLVKPKLRSGMGLNDPALVERSFEITSEALDRVAESSAETGYLVGNGFSVADLTAAALLSPAANPDHPDMKRPEPKPKAVDDWLAIWADHPGCAWVRGIYERHRPPSNAA